MSKIVSRIYTRKKYRHPTVHWKQKGAVPCDIEEWWSQNRFFPTDAGYNLTIRTFPTQHFRSLYADLRPRRRLDIIRRVSWPVDGIGLSATRGDSDVIFVYYCYLRHVGGIRKSAMA